MFLLHHNNTRFRRARIAFVSFFLNGTRILFDSKNLYYCD